MNKPEMITPTLVTDSPAPIPPITIVPYPHTDAKEFDLREILRILWRQRLIIAGTLSAGLVLCVLILWQLTPHYTATTQILIDPRQQNIVNLNEVISGLPMNAETIQSEIEIITSRSLAGRVIDDLKLQENENFNTAIAETENNDPSQTHNRLIDAFVSALSVKAAGRSRVIDVAFTSTDAALAATITNALADRYLVEQLEAKFEATRHASAWLDERLEQLRINAERAELAVARFKNPDSKDVKTDISEIRANLKKEQNILAALKNLRTNPQGQIPAEYNELNAAYAQLNDATTKLAEHVQNKADSSTISTAKTQQAMALHDFKSQLEADINAGQARVLDLEANLASIKLSQPQNSGKMTANEIAVRLTTLEREAKASRALYETFLNRSKETGEQQGLQRADARVISEASIPNTASFPNKKNFLILGILMSLGLGLALAFVAEQLDSGFRSSDQLEKDIGLPALARIPTLASLRVKEKGIAPEAYIATKPNSALAESVRMLRTALLLSNVENPPRVLLITSTLPNEGKTTTALMLARLASMAGEKVVLVDADLRHPCIHTALGLENKKGLTDILTGTATLEKVLLKSTVEGKTIDVIPAGEKAPYAIDLIRSAQMKRFIRSLASAYSLVIIDSPPVLPVADAKILASLVDKVLYVVRWRDTNRELVVHAVQQLHDVRANFAGVVLNQVDVQKHAEYSYSDSGYYYYGRYQKYYTD